MAGVCCHGLAQRKSLPEKVIVGYASRCGDGSVTRAVEGGVNVVIWSFVHVSPGNLLDVTYSRSSLRKLSEQLPIIGTNLDMDCIRHEIQDLEKRDYNDVIHLVSFGGWNERHLNVNYSSKQIYDSWKELGGDIFDGIDWDFEGNDDVQSSNNFFSMDTLDRMGEISQLAKKGTFSWSFLVYMIHE